MCDVAYSSLVLTSFQTLILGWKELYAMVYVDVLTLIMLYSGVQDPTHAIKF